MKKTFDELTCHQMTICQDLWYECIHNAPDTKLSYRLRTALESMQPEERSEVVSQLDDGCAPLFLACEKGKVEIVQYLLRVCGADVEQRGDSLEQDEENVTPLWCAAVAGHLSVVRALVDAGAELNAASVISGSTPVCAASAKMRVDVVRFLVDRGANIHHPDYDGETCLIKSVDSEHLCLFIIERGININACNTNGETALHFAVKRKNIDTVRLLIQQGADPHARCNEDDDALQLACLIASTEIVDLLTSLVHYPPERLADMLDLLAAALYLDCMYVEEALSRWRCALALREQHTLPKRPELLPRVAFQYAREFRNEAELAAATTDEDALGTQALLVFERVLGGGKHRAFSRQLMMRGLRYESTLHQQRCIDLWLWALEVRMYDPLLYAEMCFTASELTKKFQNLYADRMERQNERIPRFRDMFRVFSLLVDSLPAVQRTIDAEPMCVGNTTVFHIIMDLLHLMLLLVVEEKNEEERISCGKVLHEKLCWMVAEDVRDFNAQDTLLHLCVLFDPREYHGQAADVQSLRCIRALLAAGADVNARNVAGCSPLLLASKSYNFNSAIVLELLQAGAHIDQLDGYGQTPAKLLASNPTSSLPLLEYISLSMQPEERSGVVSQLEDSCTPLILACKRHKVEIVQNLLHVCGADVK